jgi:hypothetical protein
MLEAGSRADLTRASSPCSNRILEGDPGAGAARRDDQSPQKHFRGKRGRDRSQAQNARKLPALEPSSANQPWRCRLWRAGLLPFCKAHFRRGRRSSARCQHAGRDRSRITVACANPMVSARQQARLQSLSAIGKVEWARDETLMDAVTASPARGRLRIFWRKQWPAPASRRGCPSPRNPARATPSRVPRIAASFAAQRRNLAGECDLASGTTAAALDVLLGPGGLEELMTRPSPRCAPVGRSGGLERALNRLIPGLHLQADEFVMGGRHGPQVKRPRRSPAATQREGLPTAIRRSMR